MKLALHSVLPVLLLLPITVTQAETCSNGLAGLDDPDGEVCCPLSCGRCGGGLCRKLPGGEESCCGSGIKATESICSQTGAAPCVIDGGDVGGPDDISRIPTSPDQTCSNGLAGLDDSNGEVCCPVSCGRCGGGLCRDLPGGQESCCGNGIKAIGRICSEIGAAPCVTDGGDVGGTDDTSPNPTSPDQTCGNGLPGFEDREGEVCCPLSCGTCGGSGCGRLPGGASCCTTGVAASGRFCSQTLAPPCMMDGDLDDIARTSETDDATLTSSSGYTISTLRSDVTDSFDSNDDDADAPPPPPSPFPPMQDVESYLITPPTEVMKIPTSCELDTPIPTFRYAATSGKVGKGRLYAESTGCFTMTDIYNWRGTVSNGGVTSSRGPIYQLDDSGNIVENPGPIGLPVTNKWLLAAELYMTDGAIFYCQGTSAGGDCDELRIQSTGPTDWYEVRGHGGSLFFENTTVTSWDTPNRAPQEEHEGGRSFLNCVSEKLATGGTGVNCDGSAKNERGECRMDIINSEMGYMGWFDAESYGLTWKVRGFCRDESNHDVFTTTNVYGDIKGSDIHHMYYGHYSYGHEGGVWTNNKMHDNFQYGFDPHDDSDYLTIAHNEVYNNFNHGIIASKRCNNVEIYDNEVRDGGPDAVGIFLHRSSDNAEVYGNTITNMKDAGIALLETMNAEIYDNIIDGAQYGIRMSLGSAGNNVHDNTFNDCSEYGLFTYVGSDPPTEGVSNGRPNQNTFDSNEVSNTVQAGVKLTFSDNMVLTNNVFTGANEIEFVDAQGNTWTNNNLPSSGVCLDIVTSDDGIPLPISTFRASDRLPLEEC